MGSWSYVSQRKGFLSDETESQPDSLDRSKNVLMGWELKTPCSYGNSILDSGQEIIQNQGLGGLGFSEIVRKQLPENLIRDVSGSKIGCGVMVNQIMVSPNAFSGDDESSSKLSSSVGEPNSRDSLLIDLKLGRFADQSDPHNSKPSRANPILSSAESSAPVKRVRAVGLSSQTAFCQVHGCNKDLSCSKDYHKRHKVCEVHSKTAKVIVNGIEQRFCQQCSRFHLLSEFDDGKRSCRKRLAGHNERRRKPQVGIHPGRTGRLLQSYNGNRFQGATLTTASFICQDILPSGMLQTEKYGMSDWCRRVKVEDGTDYSRQSAIPISNGQLHPKSLFPLYDFEKQYSPFQESGANTGSMFSVSSTRYPHDLAGSNSGPRTFFQDASLGSEDLTVFDTTSTVQGLSGISDSGRALSLLSSQSQNSSSHSSGIPMAQPLIMPSSHAHYSATQVSEKFLGINPTCSMSGVSDKFPSSGMNSADGNHRAPMLISDGSDPINFEVTDEIFQGSDFVNAKDRLPCETGPTIDLLQLSSQLQRVEHQRRSMQIKHENDTFCLRIT